MHTNHSGKPSCPQPASMPPTAVPSTDTASYMPWDSLHFPLLASSLKIAQHSSSTLLCLGTASQATVTPWSQAAAVAPREAVLVSLAPPCLVAAFGKETFPVIRGTELRKQGDLSCSHTEPTGLQHTAPAAGSVATAKLQGRRTHLVQNWVFLRSFS